MDSAEWTNADVELARRTSYQERYNELKEELDVTKKLYEKMKETLGVTLYEEEKKSKQISKLTKKLDIAKSLLKDIVSEQELLEANLECSNESRKRISLIFSNISNFLITLSEEENAQSPETVQILYNDPQFLEGRQP